MKIEGSSVFVTGGASGLGEATVRALAARGARVAIYDLPRSKGAELEKEIGPAARFLAGDVTDEGQVGDALDAAIAAFGPLRGLVNCAGIGSASRTVGKDARAVPARRVPAHDRGEPDRHVQRDPARGRAHGRQRARRERRARRDREYRVDRRVRGPDRAGRLLRFEGRRGRHDAADRARSRAPRDPRVHDRAGPVQDAAAR